MSEEIFLELRFLIGLLCTCKKLCGTTVSCLGVVLTLKGLPRMLVILVSLNEVINLISSNHLLNSVITEHNVSVCSVLDLVEPLRSMR